MGCYEQQQHFIKNSNLYNYPLTAGIHRTCAKGKLYYLLVNEAQAMYHFHKYIAIYCFTMNSGGSFHYRTQLHLPTLNIQVLQTSRHMN